MGDVNFSLDEYIARKSIASPPSAGGRGGGAASRGGSARGGGRGGGGGGGGGGIKPSLAGRLGSRQPYSNGSASEVKPLMNIAVDARDKLIEKARQGDARDKIILKNRIKYKDAREKIGHPQPPPPPPQQPMQDHADHRQHQNQPQHHRDVGRNGSARPAIFGTERLPASNNSQHRPLHQQQQQQHHQHYDEPMDAITEEEIPRRRPDAQVFGRHNNIIVTAKNDFSSGGGGGGGGRSQEGKQPLFKSHQPMRHANPVVVIKNDRLGHPPPSPPPEELPPSRFRAQAPQAKLKVASPRRGEAPIQRRQQQQPQPVQRKQSSMEARLGAPNRSRSPLDNGRLSSRQPPPPPAPPARYDSGSEDEEEQLQQQRRKQIPLAAKRAAAQAREAPRPEKQPRRSPEPPRLSARNPAPAPVKKSTSILRGVKPVASSQIPKDSPPESGDKQSPLQGFRVLVTNLHSIVTQEDVVELFSACGALKRTKMTKVGSAEVVFVKREDAEMAVKKYNNRELDGQPMQCKLATPAKPTKPNEEPLLGGRLKPAKPPGEGVEATTIHKALFNAAAAAAEKSAKPVVFTVKI